jgi:hypothetical protein
VTSCATSAGPQPNRARAISELTDENPGLADLLADLEANDTLRTRFEIELLRADRPP